MRIALRQQTGHRRYRRQAGQRERIAHRLCRIGPPQLDREMPELVGEPCFPGGVDVIADLQDGPETA